MSTPKDPLLDFNEPDRVHYATGTLLDATDFQAEQVYHRGRLARVLAGLHGFGTIAGLEVTYKHIGADGDTPTCAEIAVKPGIALDPLGRLVEVPREACIRVKNWLDGYKKKLPLLPTRHEDDIAVSIPKWDNARQAVVADIFLRFRTQPRGKTPAFVAGPFDATDAVQPSRLRDGYELRMVMRTEATLPSVPTSWWPWLKTNANDGPWKTMIEATNQDPKRKELMRNVIFASWSDTREDFLKRIRGDGLLPADMRKSPDVTGGDEDPAWVFLARVLIGELADNATWTDEKGVLVDNDRPFSLSTPALAWCLGL